MIMQTAEGRRLERLIEAYAAAKIMRARMGGMDPADYPAIEECLKRAKKKLYDEVRRLTSTPRSVIDGEY